MSDNPSSSTAVWLIGAGVGFVLLLLCGGVGFMVFGFSVRGGVGPAVTATATAPPPAATIPGASASGGARVLRIERARVAVRLADQEALDTLLQQATTLTRAEAIKRLGLPPGTVMVEADDYVKYEFEVVAPSSGLLSLTVDQEEVVAAEFTPSGR